MDRFQAVAHRIEKRMIWHKVLAGVALAGITASAFIVTVSATSLHGFVIASQHFVTRC
jgi:hypothetical protein